MGKRNEECPTLAELGKKYVPYGLFTAIEICVLIRSALIPAIGLTRTNIVLYRITNQTLNKNNVLVLSKC